MGRYADRSDRMKLRLTGEQRLWFLHQILTQDFEDMVPGEARDALMLTVHGRIRAFVESVATDDALLMHGEPDLRATFPEELRRYVFATRVEIEDVSDDLGLILLVGPDWEQVARDVAPAAVPHPTSGIGVDAGYLWVGTTDVAEVRATLVSRGLDEISEGELELLRIEHRIPRWGQEMDEKTLPQEVAIDSSAVHYEKGCYLGQEAMAKIHFRGKVNRRLVRLALSSPVAEGDLMLADERVGRITTSSGSSALGIVRTSVPAEAELSVGTASATVLD